VPVGEYQKSVGEVLLRRPPAKALCATDRDVAPVARNKWYQGFTRVAPVTYINVTDRAELCLYYVIPCPRIRRMSTNRYRNTEEIHGNQTRQTTVGQGVESREEKVRSKE
jgi:hypothetical protein